MTNRPSITEIQEELIEDFSFFDDWMDRYRYIIQMGDALAALDEAEMVDENLLKGCQSQVWLLKSGDGAGRLQLKGTSDAAIVRGLVALMLKVYDDQPAQDVLDNPPNFITEIGLDDHLSPTRKNGLASMVTAIQDSARALLA
ncbi:MAG: SufE family protein [Alphaproteobacteria bacterium]